MHSTFRICIPALAIAMIGCTHTPPPKAEQTVTVSNSAFKVEQLFTDPTGTTIFRFYDMGEWRYYASNPKTGMTQMLPTTKTVYVDTDDELAGTTIIEDHGDHHGGHDGGGGGGGGGGGHHGK